MRRVVQPEPAAALAFDPAQPVTDGWVQGLAAGLEAASWRGPGALKACISPASVLQLLGACTALLKAEPTLLQVQPPEGASVAVVGDTHGQLHDVLKLLGMVGPPSASRLYVFNGDFVDRGTWGLEVLLVLAAWKLARPAQCFLLRGNHECQTCTMLYGFKRELSAKFSGKDQRAVYSACKALFAHLPLAARVAEATLVLHGGLFRRPAPRGKGAGGSKKRKRPPSRLVGGQRTQPLELGSLADLAVAGKGGVEPDGGPPSEVATDVLWSDPVVEPGLLLNTARGVGLVFGPDQTQARAQRCVMSSFEAFLEANGLRLVLRSHEGPDARADREDLPPMADGFTVDHTTPAGRLCTVFSAPDYPQFQAEEERSRNLAAVALLTGPTWGEPRFLRFSAVLPRPPADAFYDYATMPGSDEEIELGQAGSETEGEGAAAARAPSLAGSSGASDGEGEGPGPDPAVDSLGPAEEGPQAEGPDTAARAVSRVAFQETAAAVRASAPPVLDLPGGPGGGPEAAGQGPASAAEAPPGQAAQAGAPAAEGQGAGGPAAAAAGRGQEASCAGGGAEDNGEDARRSAPGPAATAVGGGEPLPGAGTALADAAVTLKGVCERVEAGKGGTELGQEHGVNGFAS